MSGGGTRVRELEPGMQFVIPGMNSAIFITQASHPYYKNLQLVIWRMDDGSLSLDALSPEQVVTGELQPCNREILRNNVKKALKLR